MSAMPHQTVRKTLNIWLRTRPNEMTVICILSAMKPNVCPSSLGVNPEKYLVSKEWSMEINCREIIITN